MDQSTPGKPVGKRPLPSGKYPAKPVSKKQRRNQAAARSISLERRPPWQSPTVVTISSVAVVAIALIVIVLINAAGGGNASTYTLAPQNVLTAVENPSTSVVNTVGTGGQPGEMVRLPASAKIVGADGKPLVVYVGAEYCPFCAAERWSMVMWLSRFGTFKNLKLQLSSSTDTDPNTNSFTFYTSSYTSQYIDFSPNEIEDRNQQPLMSMSPQISSIFTKYNNPPYTQQSGQFPFVDIGGYFSLYSTSYNPVALQNLSWSQIAAKLSNPNDPVTKDIVGNANILTAATCIATGDTPSSVCSSSTIQSIEQTLKAIKTPAA